jgi:hypothetical protein
LFKFVSRCRKIVECCAATYLQALREQSEKIRIFLDRTGPLRKPRLQCEGPKLKDGLLAQLRKICLSLPGCEHAARLGASLDNRVVG